MPQILAITIIVLITTSCSIWVELDSQLVKPDSYLTATPTPTLSFPWAAGVHVEETNAPILHPTATVIPFLDIVPDVELLPWFPVMVP